LGDYLADYERRKSWDRGGSHLGGSGQPDYIRGETLGEVKNWQRPMNRSDVKREAQKGRNEIVSRNGFTDSALEYAEMYRPGLRLIDGNTIVKSRHRY